MEIVPFLGWNRCARLVCNDVEMIVTLEVGPRILRYGFIDGPNLFHVLEDDAGKTGGDEYRFYGGHRLWIAPEDPPRTMQPDNEPVEYTVEENTHIFTGQPDTFHMQKQLRITVDEAIGRFVLEHQVHNRSPYEVELAAWSPTQCTSGTVLFPQAPFQPHTERLLPTRPLAMWGYTKIGDPRWTWGDKVVRLRQDSAMSPQKVGTLVEQGYAACALHDSVFLKRFPFEPGADYPDFNSNFETFTNESMIEIESLGPLTLVEPGDYASHTETWYLIRNQTPPEGDDECAAWLEGLVRDRPF
jgi:hypothetical protein